MNEYKVFYKVKNNISKIINIFIGLLIILGGITLIILMENPSIFNIIVIAAFILFIISSILERKNAILKEPNKAFLDKPIVFDNNGNMYVLIDKSGKILLIMVAFIIMMIVLLKLGGDRLYCFILWCLLIVIELGNFLRNANIEYLRKNTNNLYNLINNNNSKYTVLKVNSISKNTDNSYIIELANKTSRQLYIANDYNNYDELIQLIDQKTMSGNNEF